MNKMGKNANLLIPSLISLVNDYNNNLRTRLKADTLFLSFDEKSKRTFNKFIDLSNDRFKLMKYGGKLNHIISNQKRNYSKINQDIQNDLLFNTNYSNIERKKLIKSVNAFKSKEISNVRDRLFETLKQRTSIDIMLREKQILKRKEKKEKQKTNLIKKFSSNTNITPILDTDGDNKVLDAKYDLIEKNIKDTIKEDQNNLMDGMESYKNLLQIKKTSLINKDKNTIINNRFIKINKNEFNDIETHLNENNIKVLSFNDDNLDNNKKKKNEDEKFDINCLYKLKNNNILNELNILPKLNLNTETETSNADDINKNMKYKIINNQDMKNIINLIKTEAYNGVMLGEKFQNRKKTFDNFYYRHFPKKNLAKISRNIKYNKTQKLTQKEEKKKTIRLKRKSSKLERILADFQKIYDDKKEIWKKEDKEKEIKEKNEEKKEQEIINFLLNLEDRNETTNKKPNENEKNK